MVMMQKVVSSNISEVGYDQATSTLYVRFKDGNRLYKYLRVPPVVYIGMLATRSKGKYFAEQIKDYFAFERAEDKEAA